MTSDLLTLEILSIASALPPYYIGTTGPIMTPM